MNKILREKLYKKYQKGIEFFGYEYVKARARQLKNKVDKTKKIVVDIDGNRTLIEQHDLLEVLNTVLENNKDKEIV